MIKAIIKNGDKEYNYENLTFVRIDNGSLTINYFDENGEEHQEIGTVPEYMWVEE